MRAWLDLICSPITVSRLEGGRIAPEPPESLGHPGQADLFTPEMIKVNPKTTRHYLSSINHLFG